MGGMVLQLYNLMHENGNIYLHMQAQQDAERRQRAQEAYTAWLKRAHTGSVNPHGTDKFQYGTPSFHNPEPWIGPLDNSTSHSNPQS